MDKLREIKFTIVYVVLIKEVEEEEGENEMMIAGWNWMLWRITGFIHKHGLKLIWMAEANISKLCTWNLPSISHPQEFMLPKLAGKYVIDWDSLLIDCKEGCRAYLFWAGGLHILGCLEQVNFITFSVKLSKFMWNSDGLIIEISIRYVITNSYETTYDHEELLAHQNLIHWLCNWW